MSGLVRNFSLQMAGQHGQGDTGAERNLGNGHSNGASPLKLFGQAKKKINDIFKDIGEYIFDCENFLEDVSSVSTLVTTEYASVVKGFKTKVTGISEVLLRDKMKVAFFGRTSNGKSTVINAMLREKILPSGIGHTTNCFLQVEGSDSGEAALLTENSDQLQSVKNIKQLASALSTYKLSSNSLLRILWPKDKCRLLKEDVVLVDSPGIDVSPDLDEWIDKFCLDADVFVLVANAESTLMQTEKNFFHKVSSRLSKPNIFVLQNRWDTSVLEEDVDEVRTQHMERNIQFLVDELKVVDQKEGEDRVFFVSAREALTCRTHQDKGTPTPPGTLAEGFQVRLFEFANFERKFEECISKSAVKTKFEQHTERGKSISSELRSLMRDIHKQSLDQKEQQVRNRCEKQDELDYLQKQLALLTGEIKEKIKSMVEDVERKVSSALNEEIRRLSTIVDEFEWPFDPDAHRLSAYKKELHAHVEKGLGRNLQTRCSAALTEGVTQTETEMRDRLSSLLPEDVKQQVSTQLPKRDFEIAYRLDCKNLCGDFVEDIDFRFSYGPAALFHRFLGPRGAKSLSLGLSESIPASVPSTPTGEGYMSPVGQDADVMVSMLSTFASLTSRSTVGAIIVTGLITKAAGWRVIAISGAIYGALYLYERLTWTNRAKERCFKRQYVDYAGSKLRLIVDLTSSNCSHQVQQELSATFARLGHQVDVFRSHLEEEIEQLDKDIKALAVVGNKAKILRNKADFLDSELNSFIKQYLTEES
ncbi:mitofusin-2-like isoform X1 [Liolophura sinensis]|uniref:mitofusin-2-like isoform X1 n=1 Tax=Liolophura sinensis TaxID=3198878 RepID=UPI0031588978